MVWGAFDFNRLARLAFICGRQTSNNYIATLEEHLLYRKFVGGKDWEFQQDEVPIHTARATQVVQNKTG